jgi:uncharacterized protein (DUF3820 family)
VSWEHVTRSSNRTALPVEITRYPLPGGKYKGLTIIELHIVDPGYLYWLSNTSHGEMSKMAKEYIDWVDN